MLILVTLSQTKAHHSDIDSPFGSLIHTNAVPSDADCGRIRALLHRAQKQVEDLDQKIEETRGQLDDLTRKRDNANQYINAHFALLSPARRLPQDIIRAIFIACMPTTRNAVMSLDDPPLLLGQICRAWQQLALSTPQLWASFHILVPSAPKIHRLTQTVASWLSRSRILPLLISFVISNSGATNIDQDLAKLLSLLADLASRWQRIRIIPPAFSSFIPLAQLSAADFPLLKTLSVGGSLYGLDLSAEPSPWRSLPVLTAPNLRSVSISSGYDFANLRVPWTQLTHLSISDTPYMWPRPFNIHDAITIMQQCAELRTCEFSLAETSDLSLPLTPVSLPHLWHFSLVDDMGDLELFKNITLPNLRSLKYCPPANISHPTPHVPAHPRASESRRLGIGKRPPH